MPHETSHKGEPRGWWRYMEQEGRVARRRARLEARRGRVDGDVGPRIMVGIVSFLAGGAGTFALLEYLGRLVH